MDQLTAPPHNRDAERGVLGGVFRDPELLPDVLAVLRPEEMYFDAHRRIFEAIARLAGRDAPVDLVLLHEELKKGQQLEDVGGPRYLADLWDAVPTGAAAVHHAKLVHEAALARSLIRVANELLRDAYSPTAPADELLATTERKLFALGAESHAGAEPLGAAELVPEALALIDRLASGEVPPGLDTGYADLDALLGGVRPEQLIVVAARPSVGKTALALGAATNATRAGTPTLFVSLEMGRREVMERVLSMRSGVPLKAIQEGRLDPHQAGLVIRAGQALAAEPFYFDDSSPMSAARLAAVVRRQVRRHDIRLVVVDYLGLLEPEDATAARVHQVGALSRRLKQLARNCSVPVLVLCQLNRASEGRADGKPKLSDLRDSGEVEQDADAVLLLSRQRGCAPADDIHLIDVEVAKNRNGMTGEVTLAYRRAVVRFENAA